MPRLRPLLSALALAFSTPALAADACLPAAAADVATLSRATLAAVRTAAVRISAGDTQGARKLLDAAAGDVARLDSAFQCLERHVSAQEDRCSAAVETLERRAGLLFEHDRALNAELDGIRATLAAATAARDNGTAELERLQRDARDAASRLAELDRRSEELRTWFWVPGYGAYLAIRTLADNDIGRLRTAQDELATARSQAERVALEVRQLAESAVSSGDALRCNRSAATGLAAARKAAQTELGTAKANRILLFRASQFFSQARVFINATGTNQLALARDLLAAFGTDAVQGTALVTDLQANIADFAARIAANPALLDAGAALCAAQDPAAAPPPDGTLASPDSQRTIFLRANGRWRAIAQDQLDAYGFIRPAVLQRAPADIMPQRGTAMPALPAGTAPPTILRNQAGTHWVLIDGTRRAVPDPATFVALGLAWDRAIQWPDSALGEIPAGPAIPTLPPGLRLLRDPADGGVWRLRDARREWIPDPATFAALGYRWDQLTDVTPTDFAAIPGRCPAIPAP